MTGIPAADTPPLPRNPTPIKPPKIFIASHWQVHAWGIGVIASYFMYEQFYLINNIHTTVFKVDPRIVFTIMALPRLFDGLLDPLIGHWSDNLRSRFGRRRPFLLVSALVGAVLASVLFWMDPDWPQWIKAIYLAFAAITLFTACGTYDMAYTALGYELSEEYADRSRIQAIKNVYHSLVAIIGGFVIGLATKPQGTLDGLFNALDWVVNIFNIAWHKLTGPGPIWTPFHHLWTPLRPHFALHDKVSGFRIISGIISCLMLLSVIFPLFWSKERYTKIVSRAHVNIWQALRGTLRCRPFVIILAINFAKGAGTLPRNLFFYIGVYSVCNGDMAKYSNVMAGNTALIAFAMALVVWPLARPITRLIGKRAAFITGAGLGLLQACLVPLVATPGHVWYWLALNMAFLPVNHILGAATSGIMPDICDLDELAYGERREGLFTAVQAFINKMEISVMTLFTGFFLVWTGFNKDLPQQPQQVLDKMRFWGFTPLIVIAAVAFLMSCFFPLTKKMMDQVRTQLDARHAQSGLTPDPTN